MTYRDEELIALSALQHLLFCERQAALIHVERQWADNGLTVEGTQLHERVDKQKGVARAAGGIRVARAMPLRCVRLGLVGRADVVELHPADDGVAMHGHPGKWRLRPVEYKRGRPKRNRCDEVQLCAQALCLEEMFETSIASGVLFYGQTRRRVDVALDDGLRAETERAAARMHALVDGGITPPSELGPKCQRCSLAAVCMPSLPRGKAASAYVERELWRVQR